MPRRVTIQSDVRPKLILLLGRGYVARRFAQAAQAHWPGVDIRHTSRTSDGYRLDDPALGELIDQADIILSSIPPSKDGVDPVMSLWAGRAPSAWIGYLSATSVYGDRGGQWAFEGEPPTPRLARGRARAEAELAWLEAGWPAHIFRLAGIYGPGRSPFDKIRAGKARAIIKTGHVVNRIHVDDIVSALMASIEQPNPQAIYNLADGNPAPPQDVLDYAAYLIRKAPPKRVPLEDPSISDMARSFYSETKRISPAKALAELNWVIKYPDYKSGLAAILAASDQG